MKLVSFIEVVSLLCSLFGSNCSVYATKLNNY